jgi:hypothetical protein
MTTSPQITSCTWGNVEVDGEGSFKDSKLYPGGARGWDWNETGTSHVPGIQPADVEELVDHGAEVVVLSKGKNRRLQVMDETLNRLEEAGVQAVVLETDQAVERYNELASQGTNVGALIHSTC